MALQVWSLDLQPTHHLGTCKKCNSQIAQQNTLLHHRTTESATWRVGPSKLTLSRWFWGTQVGEPLTWGRNSGNLSFFTVQTMWRQTAGDKTQDSVSLLLGRPRPKIRLFPDRGGVKEQDVGSVLVQTVGEGEPRVNSMLKSLSFFF